MTWYRFFFSQSDWICKIRLRLCETPRLEVRSPLRDGLQRSILSWWHDPFRPVAKMHSRATFQFKTKSATTYVKLEGGTKNLKTSQRILILKQRICFCPKRQRLQNLLLKYLWQLQQKSPAQNIRKEKRQRNFDETSTGWWFQPIWKILVKLGHFPK